MKQLNNYISEKLILNKNIKSPNRLFEMVKLMIDWFYIPAKSEYFEHIKQWLQANEPDYDDLEPCADPEVVHSLPDRLQDRYNDSYSLNELCQYELDKTHLLYQDKGLEFRDSDKMICCMSSYGTIYIRIKSKLKE